mmetsp:Transcript_74048/g.130878  ORF Transcript_74048/g.130878 Transcript_74048/m.130878 type:complete len:261 (+) Transcript_74048:750-1532(+)
MSFPWIANVCFSCLSVGQRQVLFAHLQSKIAAIKESGTHDNAVPQEITVSRLLPKVAAQSLHVRALLIVTCSKPVQIKFGQFPDIPLSFRHGLSSHHERTRPQRRAVSLWMAPLSRIRQPGVDDPLGLRESSISSDLIMRPSDPCQVCFQNCVKIFLVNHQTILSCKSLQRFDGKCSVPHPVVCVTPLIRPEGWRWTRRCGDGSCAIDVEVGPEVLQHLPNVSIVEWRGLQGLLQEHETVTKPSLHRAESHQQQRQHGFP